MSAYIVRLIDTDELVGLLITDTVKDLFWAVDEVTDPNSCEFKRIKFGGILWHVGTGQVYEEDDSEEPAPLDGASFSEYTMAAYEDGRRWKQFEPGVDWYKV
jgi:hypothetical protein